MKAVPVSKLHFEFATKDGVPFKYRFVLTTSKSFGELKGSLEKALMTVDGIDVFQPIGRYSAEIVVARTYDPEQVINVLQSVLEPIMTELILPSKIIQA
jgi:hypothetical protein